MSDGIGKLVAMTNAHGFVADEGEWSKAFVYWFDALMPSDVRGAGASDRSLEHFNSDGTPHQPAGEGFIDRETNIAISFLLEFKEA